MRKQTQSSELGYKLKQSDPKAHILNYYAILPMQQDIFQLNERRTL